MISVFELPNHCNIHQIFGCGALVFPDHQHGQFLGLDFIGVSSPFCCSGDLQITSKLDVLCLRSGSYRSIALFCAWEGSDEEIRQCAVYILVFVSHIFPVMYPVCCGRLQPGSYRFDCRARLQKLMRQMCLLSILSSLLFFFHVLPVMYLSIVEACDVGLLATRNQADSCHALSNILASDPKEIFRRHFVVAVS